MSNTFKDALEKNIKKVREDSIKGKPANVRLLWDDAISEEEKKRNNSSVRPDSAQG